MAKISLWVALLLAMSNYAFCGEAAVHLNRGVEKFQNGDFDGAIADYSKAIELKPNDALGYYNRGIAKNAKKDSDGAIADYDKAIELNPKHAEAYYNRGNAKRDKTNGFDSAVMDFNKAIQLKPSFAEAHNNRGVARALNRGVDDAVTDFTKAIELKSDLLLASTNRSRAKKMKDGELAPVIDWLIEEGAQETLGSDFLKGLGLDDSDASVRKKIYEGSTDKLLSMVAVTDQRQDVIFSRRSKARTGLVWLTSHTGDLRATAIITNGASLKIVPSEPYAKGFLNQKRYFLGLAIVPSQDASPSRAND